MRNHIHHRPLLAAVAATAALAGTAPAALAMPMDAGKPAPPMSTAAPEPVKVVRVQVDEGLDWADTGIGAAGMLALVLVGFGGARVLSSPSDRRRTAAHS
jgi:hypothetical protein